MSANTFGELFRVTTFGESHGGAVGCIIDGCPAGIDLSEKDIQPDLDRRKPGQSHITTQRNEDDEVKILSGVENGKTLGTPIMMQVQNKDAKGQHYEYLKDKFRPSHADYTYQQKYGIRAWRGGGRASARETIGRVMAGAVAKKFLKEKYQLDIIAYVSQIYDIKAEIDPNDVTYSEVEQNIVRCPNQSAASKMISLIEDKKAAGDSVGGLITCVIKNVPLGLGEPVFDKLDAELAKGMMSIPATKGFEIGSGFDCVAMTGSQHNDAFYNKDGIIKTKTNNSGGIQGGISNGENIIFNVAFKPTSTITCPQESVNDKGEEIKLENIKGRHDPCVVPRALPIVESMAWIVILDHVMRQKVQNHL